MGNFFLWIFVGSLTVMGVAALMASVFRRRQDRLLATTGRGAIGRVLDVGRDTSDPDIPSYWVRVQYNCDGEPFTAKVKVSQREQGRYRAGQRVGLTYAPSRPQIVRLDPPEWPLPQAR
jgi:hypothetical protein